MNKIKYYELNYKELDNYKIEFRKPLNKIFIIYLTILIIFVALALLLMFIFKPTEDQMEEIAMIFIIGLPIILYAIFQIYTYIYRKMNKGRTVIKIPVSMPANEIDEKMKKILSHFYYKEKKYKGEKLYYACLQKVLVEPLYKSSYNRYIKYSISNNILEIHAWIHGELPIDQKYFGSMIKKILLIELQEIKNYILLQN